MTTTKTTTADNAIQLTMTIPWSIIDETYNKVVDDMVGEAELDGFRKGKAPRAVVEPKLDRTKVFEEVVRRVIPKTYADAVTAEKIKPIVTPKVELKEAQEGKDWTVVATTCERPAATIGDYKKAVTELKAGKANKIWTPGSAEEDKKEEAKKPTLDEILMSLYSVVTVTIPAILLESEVNRLLSELIDQTKRLGLTVEQYLGSTGRTTESIQKEYQEQARRTITLELVLEDIADKEGLLVTDDEIDAIIKNSKTDEERSALEKQRYYLATVMRRQKTLDYLSAL